MSTTFTESITLERISCKRCGGTFALNQDFLQWQRENAGGYHCPYCDTRWGWSESEADKLRKQLMEKEGELNRTRILVQQERLSREASEAREKSSQRKMSRVHKGVCPCCNRFFNQLARHMASKHPEAAK